MLCCAVLVLCYAMLCWAGLGNLLCCAGAVKIDRGKQKGQRVLAWGNHRAGKPAVLVLVLSNSRLACIIGKIGKIRV